MPLPQANTLNNLAVALPRPVNPHAAIRT